MLSCSKRILREDRDINVPLYAHTGGRSALSTGDRRIEDVVIVKLIRLCGGDFFQHGVFGVKDTHIASLDEKLFTFSSKRSILWSKRIL